MSYYAMVFHRGGYIIFGGYFGGKGRTSTIARFDESTREWSKLGSLLTPRSEHGVIYMAQSFLVIGGKRNKNDFDNFELRTEKCDIENDSLTCRYHSSTLENFFAWPATVFVDDTFDQ